MLKKIINNVLISLYMSKTFSKLRHKIRKKSITILTYHQIDKITFEKHIKYLAQRYNIIGINQLYCAFINHDAKSLPENCLLITFDDGWKSNYDLLPVFKKYNSRVVIFLSAGLAGTNRKIWNYTLNKAVKDDYKFNQKLKNMPNTLKNNILFKKNGHYPEKEYPNREILNLKEIEEMLPFADFHSHGMFHPVFLMCTNEELDFELSKSKKIIEEITKSDCYAIAYPYGRCNDRELKMAKNAGYKIGRIANKPGVNTLRDNPMKLKSIGIRASNTCKDVEKSIVSSQIRSIMESLLFWRS